MRKEVLFAILAGVTLGLILAFGVWRANLALRSKDSPPEEPSEETQPQEATFGITLAAPNDFEVVSQSPFLISGITKPELFVAISGVEEDFVVKSDVEGEFKQEITLIEGVNEITITAFDADGVTIEKRLLIAYSTEFAKQVEASIPSPTQTEEETATEANEVREKVQEKVNEAMRVPKFVMGSVTDKLAGTIELRDLEGEIRQVSLSPDEAVFVKIAKTRTEVKFADLAIGDFIVAMGFSNGNGVLEGKRILITTEFETSGREAILGTVLDPKKAEFTLKTVNDADELLIKNSEELTIFSQLGDEEEEIDFADLEEDQQVIALGVKDDANFVARTVVVVAEFPSL